MPPVDRDEATKLAEAYVRSPQWKRQVDQLRQHGNGADDLISRSLEEVWAEAQRYVPGNGSFVDAADGVVDQVRTGSSDRHPAVGGLEEVVERVSATAQALGRTPTSADVVDATGMPMTAFRKAEKLAAASGVDLGLSDGIRVHRPEGNTVDQRYPKLEAEAADELLEPLGERRSEVLRRRHVDGDTIPEIADDLGVSDASVSHYATSGMRRLIGAEREKQAAEAARREAEPVPAPTSSAAPTPLAQPVPAPPPPARPIRRPGAEATPVTGSVEADSSAPTRRRTAQSSSVAQLQAETRQAKYLEDHDATQARVESGAAPEKPAVDAPTTPQPEGVEAPTRPPVVPVPTGREVTLPNGARGQSAQGQSAHGRSSGATSGPRFG